MRAWTPADARLHWNWMGLEEGYIVKVSVCRARGVFRRGGLKRKVNQLCDWSKSFVLVKLMKESSCNRPITELFCFLVSRQFYLIISLVRHVSILQETMTSRHLCDICVRFGRYKICLGFPRSRSNYIDIDTPDPQQTRAKPLLITLPHNEITASICRFYDDFYLTKIRSP